MFTPVYSCLPMFTCFYLFFLVKLRLPRFNHVCLRALLPCPWALLPTYVYTCLPMFTPCLLVFTYVYSCLPMLTPVYSCLPLFTLAFLHIFTHVYSCLPMFTRLYLFSVVSFFPRFTNVCLRALLPCLWALLPTYIYP